MGEQREKGQVKGHRWMTILTKGKFCCECGWYCSVTVTCPNPNSECRKEHAAHLASLAPAVQEGEPRLLGPEKHLETCAAYNHGRTPCGEYILNYAPVAPPPQDSLEQEPELLARAFHETYERLAPSFGYETRKESAKPWEQVPEQNRRLMTAVCAEIIRTKLAQSAEEARAKARAEFDVQLLEIGKSLGFTKLGCGDWTIPGSCRGYFSLIEACRALRLTAPGREENHD
jgi:hypothetical protein